MLTRPERNLCSLILVLGVQIVQILGAYLVICNKLYFHYGFSRISVLNMSPAIHTNINCYCFFFLQNIESNLTAHIFRLFKQLNKLCYSTWRSTVQLQTTSEVVLVWGFRELVRVLTAHVRVHDSSFLPMWTLGDWQHYGLTQREGTCIPKGLHEWGLARLYSGDFFSGFPCCWRCHNLWIILLSST